MGRDELPDKIKEIRDTLDNAGYEILSIFPPEEQQVDHVEEYDGEVYEIDLENGEGEMGTLRLSSYQNGEDDFQQEVLAEMSEERRQEFADEVCSALEG